MFAVVRGSHFEKDVCTRVNEVMIPTIVVEDPQSVFVGFRCNGGYHFPPALSFPERRPFSSVSDVPQRHGALHFLAEAPTFL